MAPVARGPPRRTPRRRRADGESVRIAKDVIGAGAAGTKVCLPDDPEEFARALARRGSRRPVVVGNALGFSRTAVDGSHIRAVKGEPRPDEAPSTGAGRAASIT